MKGNTSIPRLVLTSVQMRELDRVAIEEYKVPSVALMENAGAAVAREILCAGRYKTIRHVCVVCGTGNNGGDGFVAVRHLLNADIRVTVFIVGGMTGIRGDARKNLLILKRMGVPLKALHETTDVFIADLREADVVVDALFGSGLDRNIDGFFQDVIKAVNVESKQIVAVDIPSGLDGTTGKVRGVCVRADMTITFDSPKAGMFKRQGPRMCGDIIVADIGIPHIIKKKRLCS